MRKKVAIGHPSMGRGGSEATCMWVIEALKDEYDVTLITTRNVDLADLNLFYGTSVDNADVNVRIAPIPFFMKNNSGISAVRGAFYSRYIKRVGKEYDCCISAYNMSDWGRPALHLIGDFAWDRKVASRFDPTPEQGSRLIHKENVLRRAYLKGCRLITGGNRLLPSYFDGKEEIYSNSRWTAKVIKENYGYFCDGNIYPPVHAYFNKVPWSNKNESFVSIGRIVQEKRIEQQIKILEKVRELGHNIHFHLIGCIGENPYGRMIRDLSKSRHWITLEGQKSGTEKESLMTMCKYAIHTRPHEAFGITVAELVRAGCIPFIPNSGGQTEIVPFRELQFGSIDEAVKKISAMLWNEDAQRAVLRKLNDRKDIFTIDRFCHEIRTIVADWLCKVPPPPSTSS